MSLLDVENLSVTYPDGFVAIHAASLTLDEGRIVALVGASGSGKSSLLRGIAGNPLGHLVHVVQPEPGGGRGRS